jgi:hypothetical protein
MHFPPWEPPSRERFALHDLRSISFWQGFVAGAIALAVLQYFTRT